MFKLSKEQTWFRLLVIVVVSLGIFFRFANLPQKVFWDDEAFTAIRISGYTAAEATQAIYDGPPVRFSDIEKYFSPRDRDIHGVIQGLALEDPHLPPLYFLMARGWSRWFGGSLAAIRSLSALFGVLALPAMYWLCWELFRSRLASWIGVVLIASSPFQVLYSQEARSYSLWTLVTLVSSALFLRSLRRPTIGNWSLYAITVSLGIYTHLFFSVVIIGHFIYLLAIDQFRISRRLIDYIISSLIGVSTFIPWLLILLSNTEKTNEMIDHSSNFKVKFSFVSFLPMWIGNISRMFFDVGLGSSDPVQNVLPIVPIILLCILIAGGSLYFLAKNAPYHIWFFVFALIAIPSIFYVTVDIAHGWRLSGFPRYYIPIFIGIELSVAYLISALLLNPYLSNYQRTYCKVTLVALLSLGIFSCVLSSPAKIWWNKGPQNTRHIPAMASQINRTAHPLVITDNTLTLTVAMVYELKPEARVQFLKEGSSLRIPLEYSDIFVFRPSDGLKQRLSQMSRGELRPLTGTENMLYQFRGAGS